MGRTLPPFRPALEMEIESWKEYRRGLRPPDRDIFDHLVLFARQHADAGSLAARPLLTDVIFFSIALEQQKQLDQQQKTIEQLEKRLKKLEDAYVATEPPEGH